MANVMVVAVLFSYAQEEEQRLAAPPALASSAELLVLIGVGRRRHR